MRYVLKPKRPEHRWGDKRQKARYLWFPKYINREVRWLENATWEEEFRGYLYKWWEKTCWIASASK